MTARRIDLVNERDGANSFSVHAYLDDEGNLRLDGQDLGPATVPWSFDGEYEWIVAVPAEWLPRAVEVLGGAPGEPILELLARRYRGRSTYGIRGTLESAGIPVKLWTWSG